MDKQIDMVDFSIVNMKMTCLEIVDFSMMLIFRLFFTLTGGCFHGVLQEEMLVDYGLVGASQEEMCSHRNMVI